MSVFCRFLYALLKEEEEARRLEELESKFQTAEKMGVNHCLKCGFCCCRRPCVPTPDEVKPIADFLGLSVRDLIFKYFCIDSNEGNIFIKPVGVNQLDLRGHYIPWDRTYNEGKCVFLQEDNSCMIYSVRPKMARQFECWKKDDDTKFDSRLMWERNKVKEIFPDWDESEMDGTE